MALRFDLTVPLAKYVALHAGGVVPLPPVSDRQGLPGGAGPAGPLREFYQADIDIIGDGKLDILNEAEIPAIIYRTFRSLGLTRFQIRVNNRKDFKRLLRHGRPGGPVRGYDAGGGQAG